MGFLILCSFISFFLSFLSVGATDVSILCPFQSVYQLGDSTEDTGNLIRVQPVGPQLAAARLPYGETFPGRPTGRWSDGRLIIDYTTMAVGLPLLNPYLDKNASFKNGVNFAVAGSTALNASILAARGVTVPPIVGSLSDQLTWFRTYLSPICSTPTECGDKLRRALIFVGETGSNDINYGLSQGKSIQEIQAYVPLVIQSIINTTREIIKIGASQIVVPGEFPYGCFPFSLNLFSSTNSSDYDELGCVRSLDDLTIYQNDILQTSLDSLRTEFPNVVIIYADFYNAFRSVLRRAPSLGFEASTLLKPCCGTGQGISSPQFCGNPNVTVCPNPSNYIHWDGIHLTQEAHRRISQIIIPDIFLKIRCSRLT